MSGITPEGFSAKTVLEIKADIETEQLQTIDPALNLASNQPIGQANAIVSAKAAEVWEALALAYNAFDRDAAEGRLLDNIGSLTGTPREPKRRSAVAVTLGLGASFSQPAGAMFAHPVGKPELKFTNRDAVASTLAGSYPATFESLEYGPIPANAGTLVISVPVTGWTTIANAEDAELGALDESDAAYRQRQEDELTAAGSSTTDAIRADLLKVAGVQQAFVFENVTMYTDADGLSPKAIECVVFDGLAGDADDDAIAQAIWNSKPSGTETRGSTSATAIDKLGAERVVYFSRAEIEDVYLSYDLTIDPSSYPPNGATLVKEAAVTRGRALTLGVDVVALVMKAAALTVPGVVDVPTLRLGFSASPTGTANLTISGRQIADFDTSRIVVTVV